MSGAVADEAKVAADAARAADIELDHRMLAQLIEAVSNLCGHPGSPECHCDTCPQSTHDACQDALFELSSKMLSLMIAHFERENELMNTLPRIPAAQRHCEQHRREHVNFSTRYNRTITNLHSRSAAEGTRMLEAFVAEWIRNHALEYDAKLAELAVSTRLH